MKNPRAIAQAALKRALIAPTLFITPRARATLQDITIELWVSRRKFPFLMRADAIILPVAPDLKMVFGVAKMARDYGANAVQYEANKVAPLPPGQAFVGTGARYRFKYTALAVIFDNVKRTSPAIINLAVRNVLTQVSQRGARSVVFPDMTENLLTQPNWITQEQRRATATVTARLMMDAILASRGVRTVRIWIWEPDNYEFFLEELKRAQREGGSHRPLTDAIPT